MKQSKRKRESTPAAGSSVSESIADSAAVVVSALPNSNLAIPAANNSPATISYKFASSCTVRDCAAIKSALADLRAAKDEIILDVSAVERIDTAVIQLLCAFVRDRKAKHGSKDSKVVWLGNSESFLDAVHVLGLRSELHVPAPMQGTSP
jgi:anti-anti-sigma regulatory factor